MSEFISYHNFLAQALILAIALNIYITVATKDKIAKAFKWVRVGYFIFWGVWAMVVFSGLIVFVFMKQPLNLSIYLMLIATAILPILDGYRAIKLGKLFAKGESDIKFSLNVLLLELVIALAVIIFAYSN